MKEHAAPQEASATVKKEDKQPADKPVAEARPVDGKSAEERKEHAAQAAAAGEDSKIFTLKSEKKLCPEGERVGQD